MYKIRSAAPKNYKKNFLLDDHFGEVRKNFNFQRDFCIDGFFFKGENTNFVTPPLQSQKQIVSGFDRKFVSGHLRTQRVWLRRFDLKNIRYRPFKGEKPVITGLTGKCKDWSKICHHHQILCHQITLWGFFHP